MPVDLEKQEPVETDAVALTSERDAARELSEDELRQVAGGVKPPPQTNPHIAN